MKGTLAWIIFGLAALTCLFWIGFSVRDDLREDAVFHEVIHERINIAESSNAKVHIGVAGDWKTHSGILQGVELAVGKLNANGGILKREIVLVPRDDKGTVDGALAVAQFFASKPEIAFVIGHTRLKLNSAVAQNYEFFGLLLLSPNMANSHSAANNFSLLFENGMPPHQTSGAILNLAKKNGWKRIGLLYAKSDSAMRQTRQFESMATKHEIQIPLSFVYEGRGSGIASHMERWKRELDLDAMVIAVDEPDVVALVSACRVIGIDCPFIVVGNSSHELQIEAAYDLDPLYCLESVATNAAGNDFNKRFNDRFGRVPTRDALLGYDALNILSQAITKSDSFVPAKVAQSLRGIEIQNSNSGTLGFDAHGTAIKRPPQYIRL